MSKGPGVKMVLGVFFLLLGISMLLKAIFGIDLPLVRVTFALFMIYLGVRALTGNFSLSTAWNDPDGRTVLFSKKSQTYDPGHGDRLTYSVIFGSSEIDLSKTIAGAQGVQAEINVVFGEAVVILPAQAPIRIRSNSVFAEAKLPDGDMVAFGTFNYQSPQVQAAPPGTGLEIRSNAVFGSLRFQSPEAGK